MNITEIRIKLAEQNSENLLAYCAIVIGGGFVIRDLKIVDGSRGVFVSMPSRKLTDRCRHCGSKNHLRARFCNDCGHKCCENRAQRDTDGRAKLYADIAHPINAACREAIQAAVVAAYLAEVEKSKHAGYVCTFDGGDEPPSYGKALPRSSGDSHA